MRRVAALVVLTFIAISLVLPLQSIRSLEVAGPAEQLSYALPSESSPMLSAVPFPDPVDTSLSVPEYPLVSRALMLDGGTTDAVLDDFDGDGIDDLAVAVTGPNQLSVFFGREDGTFLSWPEVNVSLSGIPIALAIVDRYEDGYPEIVVLEKKADALSYDNFVRVNTTTWVSTSPFTVPDGALDVLVGNFTGTSSPDIVIVSEGTSPPTSDGKVQIFVGPQYSDFFLIKDGPSANSIASGDFDDDGIFDLAVVNEYDQTVEVFLSPLEFAMTPSSTLDVAGGPVWLASGHFNGDLLTDLVVACQEPSSLEFFFQAASTGLPTGASLELDLPVSPSRVVQGDMDSDSKADILVSSESSCRILGFYQGISPLWPSAPSFSFPSGSVPRGAIIGDLTGDYVPDIGVTSARTDWSGSSMAVYPARTEFSNSNHTVWTTFDQQVSLMATGDLNGDGREDLIVSLPDDTTFGSFGYMLGYSELDTGLGEVILGYSPDDLVVRDFDDDGLADVVTSNRTVGTLRVDFGDPGLPEGSTDSLTLTCSGDVKDLVAGDFNNDGLQDLAAATGAGTIDVFLNTASEPVFDSPSVVVISETMPVMAMAAGDLDSDGLDDLVCTASSDLALVFLQRDTGDPISLPASYTLQASPGPIGSLWSGDVTGDRKHDVVAMDAEGDKIFLFDQDRFAEVSPYQTTDLPEAPSFISLTDVTDDEHSDLLAVFPSADLLFLYKQDGSSLPESPSMTFVTGARPVCACLGDATGEGVGDLQVLESESESLSVFERVVLDVGPTAAFELSVPSPSEGDPFWFIDASVGYDPIVTWVWTLTYPDTTTEVWELDDSGAISEVVFEVGDGDYSMRLDVYESDWDTDSCTMDFSVLEASPGVTISMSPTGGIYDEFQAITFTAEVDSQDPAVLFEWDFDAEEAEFLPDYESETAEASKSYDEVGAYTVKVRVTDSNGSATVSSVVIAVLDAGLSGTFEDDIVITRDTGSTSTLTFDASALALFFPDITSSFWDFGDGTTSLVSGPPTEPVTHSYAPVTDYEVSLNIVDDDGNSELLVRTLHMSEPTIDLIDPDDGSVVNSGTLVSFSVGDDAPPVVYVMYSVNGGEYLDFETQYSISTEGWEDGVYVIEVIAEDKDGNIARETGVTVTVDDTVPSVTMLWGPERAYGGEKVNVTISVVDANLGPGDVVLYVTFPGDDSPTSILMHADGQGGFYALVEVPKRAGEMEFYVEVTDLAGNTVTSETFSVAVELRFIDAAWPFLLLLAVAAALATGAYFLRETSIAVDETFVIYGDGRLLAHSTRRLKPGMDDQVLSGMFVAVQDFIKDSFKDETSFRLRKLDFGDKSVLVEKGEHLFLAVVLHGKASRKVARRMKSVLDGIEDEFSEHLVDWDGDLDKVRGVNEMVKRLYSKAPMFPVSLGREEE